MNWFISFLTSSIGRKLVISLTGLFLIIFLIIHLIGNLQLMANDGGMSFNLYAKFMTTNSLIKFSSYGLYAGILVHGVVGIFIYFKNYKAKGKKYNISSNAEVSWASKNMALLGILILAFLLLHMGDFWYQMKFTDNLKMILYQGQSEQVKDLYSKVVMSFNQPVIVVAYIVGLIALSFHLWHGFESAFQTLGIQHQKYTPIIKTIGKLYSIVIPLLYAIIPLSFYFKF